MELPPSHRIPKDLQHHRQTSAAHCSGPSWLLILFLRSCEADSKLFFSLSSISLSSTVLEQHKDRSRKRERSPQEHRQLCLVHVLHNARDSAPYSDETAVLPPGCLQDRQPTLPGRFCPSKTHYQPSHTQVLATRRALPPHHSDPSLVTSQNTANTQISYTPRTTYARALSLRLCLLPDARPTSYDLL